MKQLTTGTRPKVVAFILIFIAVTFSLLLTYPTWSIDRHVLPQSDLHFSWKDIVAAKLKADAAKIPEDWVLSPDVIRTARERRQLVGDFFDGLLDEKTRAITVMNESSILESLASGQVTAVNVCKAFCKRAAYAHQIVSEGRTLIFHVLEGSKLIESTVLN
jgi:amidase